MIQTSFHIAELPVVNSWAWRVGTQVGISHHGDSSGGAKPCSIDAFAAAVELGFRHIESDLRVTGDGHLLAVHDIDAKVDGRPFHHLDRATIEQHYQRPLVDLDTMMSRNFEGVLWNFEVKGHPDADALIRTLCANPAWLPRICVSWGPTFGVARRSRRDHGEADSHIATAASLTELVLRQAAAAVTLGRWSGATKYRCAQYHWSMVSRSLVRSLHASGTAVHAWGATGRRRMSHLLEVGVDAVITTDHVTLAALLADRTDRKDRVTSNSPSFALRER